MVLLSANVTDFFIPRPAHEITFRPAIEIFIAALWHRNQAPTNAEFPRGFNDVAEDRKVVP